MTRSPTTDRLRGLPHWPARLREVPPNGRHVRHKGLSEAERAAFAAAIGVDAVLDLDLDVTVKPYRGDGLSVTGSVTARVRQTCVVSLEPVESLIEEEVEATFRPAETLQPHLIHDDEDGMAIDASVSADDPLVGGEVDLAEVAAEFLALGVDPYPRRPGVAFEAPADGEEPSPFAALGRLKDKP